MLSYDALECSHGVVQMLLSISDTVRWRHSVVLYCCQVLEGFSLISVDNVIVCPTLGTAPGQHSVIAATQQQMGLLPVYLPATHLDSRQLPLLS